MTILRHLFQSPSRLLIVSFMALILLGTFLLMLPAASVARPLPWIDALFTSTSAVCVTGLIVVDTGANFTVFGHIVILMLIQLGGIGIMTYSTLFLLIAGKRPGLASQTIIQDTFTHSQDRTSAAVLKDVVLFTLGIESLGVLLLFFGFLPEKGMLSALYFSIFHAVSAFCNAGFSLFSDSFIQFRGNWILMLGICFLIISGGLGFLVVSEIKQHFNLKHHVGSRLSLHSKLVLSTTALLLITGTLLILFMEWKNTLADLSVPGRVLSAFF
ncbi:MAG: potassium transporter TrkG, partial [Desulfobacterales bacterium]|nr:potassium transporter TrkG [Desulfobacterales bacterium]